MGVIPSLGLRATAVLAVVGERAALRSSRGSGLPEHLTDASIPPQFTALLLRNSNVSPDLHGEMAEICHQHLH